MIKSCENCEHQFKSEHEPPCKECINDETSQPWEPNEKTRKAQGEIFRLTQKFYRLPVVDGMVTIPASDYKKILEYLEDKPNV